MNYDTVDTYAALIGGVGAAYRRLQSGDTTPGLLDIVARDPYYAYLYSRHVIQNRWPDAEPVIAQHSGCAYQYARDVIKGRWPAVESVIAEDSVWAYYYSRDIIKGPWPKAGIREL